MTPDPVDLLRLQRLEQQVVDHLLHSLYEGLEVCFPGIMAAPPAANGAALLCLHKAIAVLQSRLNLWCAYNN